jgi:tRNA-2-methylthio-N6-dimethylallyladenosine synthase
VHFTPAGSVVDRAVRPGDIVETVVTYGAPHHLVADGELISHRRTRAGDNVEAGLRPKTNGVGLGLPSFGAPPIPAATTGGCAL